MTNLRKVINKIQSVKNAFFRMSLKKRILFIIVFFIAIFIIGNQINNLTKPPGYTTQKVSKSNITEFVTESGNISSTGKIDVYSPTNGFVTVVNVQNGSYVNDGDVLFYVESAATEQESKQAQANYLAAVAALNTAQSNANLLRADMYAQWKTFTDLATNSTYEKGDDTPNLDNRKAAEFQIEQDTWLATEKKYKDQQTAIAQASAAVSSTNALYQATKDAVVKAQSEGVVTNLSVTRGSNVSINNPVLGGTTRPALVLSQQTEAEIVLQLSETDITKIKEGQKAMVTINAANDKVYEARVNRVDSIGTDSQGVVTYNVYLHLLKSDDTLRSGMTVDADIITNELTDVLSVHNSAIKPYQGGKAVRIPDKSVPSGFRYSPVIIGIRGEKQTQILKGLSIGQEVITTFQNESLKRPGLFGN